MGDNDDDAGEASVLRRAIAKQEAVLRSMQSAHGEFHPSVSDDLAQLALLYNMSGEFDKALPLLHKRLVIHEKFGPDELTGETLQDLGTVYRLHGVLEVAHQHLERALAIRERCHGADSLKVAETLNSLALVHLVRNDAAQAETCQLRSLQVLFESAEPEDIESEDVPWEVYKRLKQQRGPSTASNSVTLLKGNMRKRVMAVAFASTSQQQQQQQAPWALQQHSGQAAAAAADGRHGQSSGPTSPVGRTDASMRRAVRSHSDTGAMKQYVDSAAEQTAAECRPSASSQRDQGVQRNTTAGVPDSLRILIQSTDATPSSSSAIAKPAPRSLHHQHQQQRTQPLSPFGAAPSPHRRLEPPPSPIPDLHTLQHRVEVLKRRISAGFGETDDELARLGADVDATETPALREVGFTMLSLVREMHRLRVTSMDAARRLPVLEGPLEKKSASIFRGWEKRWFKVDAKTFVLSYHFSKDDYARGFAPRGGFPLSRVANILVHRHARGHYFHFDVVVDLSTRLNPHAARTYELRCEDEDTLRYWVETLHYYKATAQTTPARPATS